MKHTLKISLIIVFAFFLSQLIGMFIISNYIDVEKTAEAGQIEVKPLPYEIPRPETEGGGSAVLSIALAVLIGTILIFVIIRFGKLLLWKVWFFGAVFFSLLFAFRAFVSSIYAAILALILAALKIFKPNIYIHNLTELFIYGGLAALIVPLFNKPETNIIWAFVLLLAISVYDIIAVWKSKHMVKLAKFQTESKVFAGVLIPYSIPKIGKKKKTKKVKVKTAILGGGDIGFPLFFTGIIMQNLAVKYLNSGAQNFLGQAYLNAMIIPIFSSIALMILFFKSKKDKFYPAMPFLSIGCLAGYLVLLLVNSI